MSELVNAFEQAVIASKQLPKKPSPQGLLQLYSLYKQATVGDNTEAQPSFTDIVARAKWEAWDKLRGTAGAPLHPGAVAHRRGGDFSGLLPAHHRHAGGAGS